MNALMIKLAASFVGSMPVNPAVVADAPAPCPVVVVASSDADHHVAEPELTDAQIDAEIEALLEDTQAMESSTSAAPCPPNSASWAPPFTGPCNFSDVLAFLVAFSAGSPCADLAQPFGVFDITDVLAFLTGC
ncbi:MAG: GC-type dockerin domain-anchored protein [Phycisphaerales bacterium]